MAINETYYSGQRKDVAALIPQSCRRILDVGCGFGGLGRLLAQHRECELYGIELNPEASVHLAGVYKQFWISDIEDAILPISPGYFDCIVFSDILEHLIDPWVTLKKYTNLLSKNGFIVASIPNIRNLSIFYTLFIKGRWQYENHGLLDRTHLRFFTRRDVIDLFLQTGLKIELIEVNKDRYSFFKKILTAAPIALIPDLGVCQFLIRASQA